MIDVVLYIGRHTRSFPRVTDPEGQPMPPLEALKITAERLGRIEDHPDFEKTVFLAASTMCERTAEWLREHGNDDAYEREVSCDCGGFNSSTWAPDIDKLADVIEGAVARVISPVTP